MIEVVNTNEQATNVEHVIKVSNENSAEQTKTKSHETEVVEAQEEEIAQAIQRVQQRIADYRKKQQGDRSSEDGGVMNVDGTLNDDGETHHVSMGEGVAEELSEMEQLTQTKGEEAVQPSVETLIDESANQPKSESIDNENEAHDSQEEEEDSPPSLSERRSLLSLAAQHNRVDVIKELISMTLEDDRDSLLQGLGGHTPLTSTTNSGTESTDEEATFVPPPLHAAVAHGSIDAASCLLRMGADPSLRPLFVGTTRDDNDGNYKKYHERTAWELAFGALIDESEEENETQSKSWFGFGSSSSKQPSNIGRGGRYKQISGLNIPPAKLDGIQNAFTAEALRAIGSDEEDRLSQLLESGMSPEIEVAGKTLKKWAGEMDAVACLALMMRGVPEEEDESDEEEEGDSNEMGTNKEEVEYVDEEATELDEQLVGLSNQDIIMLIQENESLIPALTACRDDLAEETDMCQNILRDIQATGGQGGLTSRSLLDLVRSLKEDRQELEELEKQWQEAWEEREDELDWFWEEAIDDELREEFTRTGVLDGVVEPVRGATKPISPEATLQELNRRYHEATDRVTTLRSSIAALAEESGRYRGEIENNGLSGALSLVKSLKSELKEIKEKISQAQAGEDNCRRKIALIQKRIEHPVNEDEEVLEDFQLNTIAGTYERDNRNPSPVNDAILESAVNSDRAPAPEVFSSQTVTRQSSSLNPDTREEIKDTLEPESESDGSMEDEGDTDSYSEESVDGDQSSYEGEYGGVETAVEEMMHKETIVENEEDKVLQHSAGIDNHDAVLEDENAPMKQSELRESGMSTAIVVR